MLEIDANPNPLRDDLVLTTRDSDKNDKDQTQRWQPGLSAGLGVTLNDDVLSKYQVFEWSSV